MNYDDNNKSEALISRKNKENVETDKYINAFDTSLNTDLHKDAPSMINKTNSAIAPMDIEVNNRFKNELRVKIIWIFILVFFIFFERLFTSKVRQAENNVIPSVQKWFGIPKDGFGWFTSTILYLQDDKYFFLLLAHVYVVFYYYLNPIVGLKIMHVTMNVLVIISIITMLLDEPRPYWDNKDIIAYDCQSSFGFPVTNVFGTTFLVLYSVFCIQKYQDDIGNPIDDSKKLIARAILGIGIMILILCKYLGGHEYLSHSLVTVSYAIIVFNLAVYFDEELTNIIENSFLDVQVGRRSLFYWFIYVSVLASICVVVYGNSTRTLQVEWIQNYVNSLLLF